MNVRYRVTLAASERVQLVTMVLGGTGAVRRLKRAQILLAADKGSKDLSTHSQAALYERFAPADARRILSRIEFHFTPKHASWLNMVEIEIGVMVQQCLARTKTRHRRCIGLC